MSHPCTTDSSRPDCDLFCRVVDNFGDIGVCWRLARCLAREHGWAVRLWVDAPSALARIKPRGGQAGVEVRHWTADMPACVPAPVVVEAFGCALPPVFVAAMAAQGSPPRWVNLEYLSAEAWVEGCHGLPSRDPASGLLKHFFFPGFTERTGGLLRERDLFARRDAWRGDPALRQATFGRLGICPRAGALQVSLFSYESASVATFVEALATHAMPVQLWVPEGRVLPGLSAALAQPLASGARVSRGTLDLQVLPFMDQDDYDALLWQCDLNVVRGEDSFVRAQWAAAPFLWHIYPQDDGAHRIKLDACLDRFVAGLDAGAAQRHRALHHGWNGDGVVSPGQWHAWLADLPLLARHTAAWAEQLARIPDLATQLVLFNQTPI